MKTLSWIRSTHVKLGAASCVAASSLLASAPAFAESPVVHHNDAAMAQLLNDARSQFPEAPALAAAIVIDNDIYLAARGVRQFGVATQVQETDAFQLGSVSKAISGALLAQAVDAGDLSWNEPLASPLPDIFSSPSNPFKTVTLLQLTTHTSGTNYNTIAATIPGSQASLDYTSAVNLIDRRWLYSSDAVADPQLFTPSDGVNYDGSHILGVAMLESVTGDAYENLVQSRVFGPLGMTHSRFTAPDAVQHGWDGINGHNPSPDPSYSNHSWLRDPVGGVCASIEDVARFAHMSLWRTQDATHFYSAAARDVLRNTAKGSNFSPGFWISANNLGGGLHLEHNGSNGRNWSDVVVWPNRKMAIVVLTNYSDPNFYGRAGGWVVSQLEQYAALSYPNVQPATFPNTSSPVYQATTATASCVGVAGNCQYSSSWSPQKAFDGSYATGWASPAGVTDATVTVTLNQTSTVSGVVMNERGVFAKSPVIQDPTNSSQQVMEYRVKAWQLWLDDGVHPFQVATGDYIGPNRVIHFASSFSGIKKAWLRMQGNVGPTLWELQLIP